MKIGGKGCQINWNEFGPSPESADSLNDTEIEEVTNWVGKDKAANHWMNFSISSNNIYCHGDFGFDKTLAKSQVWRFLQPFHLGSSCYLIRLKIELTIQDNPVKLTYRIRKYVAGGVPGEEVWKKENISAHVTSREWFPYEIPEGERPYLEAGFWYFQFEIKAQAGDSPVKVWANNEESNCYEDCPLLQVELAGEPGYYADKGTFTSGVIDLGQGVKLNSVKWESEEPTPTRIDTDAFGPKTISVRASDTAPTKAKDGSPWENKDMPSEFDTIWGGPFFQFACGGETGWGDPSPSNVCEAYDPDAGTWSTKQQLVVKSCWNASFSGLGKGYIAAGYSSYNPDQKEKVLQEFDFSSNTWSLKSDLPDVANHCRGFRLKRGYVVGGYNDLSKNWGFDFSSNTWATYQTLLIKKIVPGAASLGGYGYIYGGRSFEDGGEDSSTTERYDEVADAWASKGSLNNTRREPQGFSTYDFLYCIGGFRDPNFLSENERYDPSVDTWTYKQSLPEAKSDPSSAIMQENTGLTCAGNCGSGYLKTNHKYSEATDTWSSLSNLTYEHAHTSGFSINLLNLSWVEYENGDFVEAAHRKRYVQFRATLNSAWEGKFTWTTQEDWEKGSPTNVDSGMSPGDLILDQVELSPDSLTLKLDHLNGSNIGDASSGITYSSTTKRLGSHSAVFDADGDYISYNATAYSEGTIEAYFYLDDLSAPRTLMSAATAGNLDRMFVRLDVDNKVLGEVLTGSGWTTLKGSRVLETGKWYHIRFCWGAKGKAIYVNRELDAADSVSSAMTSDTARFGLGAIATETGKVSFRGKADEFRLSSKNRVDSFAYAESGTWIVNADSGEVGSNWGKITWESTEQPQKSDNFDDDSIDSEWNTWYNISGVSFEETGGELKFSGTPSASGWSGIHKKDFFPRQSVVLSIKIKTPSGTPTDTTGVLFRLAAGPQDYVQFRLGTSGYIFEKVENGTQPSGSIIGPLSYFGDETTEFHTLKIIWDSEAGIAMGYVDSVLMGSLAPNLDTFENQWRVEFFLNSVGGASIDRRFEDFLITETEIKARVRSAASEEDLDTATWYPATGYYKSGDDVECPNNQWIQIEMTLTEKNTAATPTLKELSINCGPG